MKQAPLPANEERRLEVLRAYNVLDTAPEENFDRLTELAARIFGVPIAVVSLVDQDREFFKSCVGVDVRQGDRKIAFCAHAILHDDVFIVEDATLDDRFVDNPQVTHGRIRFYAGAPIRTRTGETIGSFCIKDVVPRTITSDEEKTLSTLAAITIDELELREAARAVREAQQAAERANAAKSQFLSNMSHEIRTPLTAILGFSELLVDTSQPDNTREEIANTIRRSGEHLLEIIGNVLDVSKIESGKLELEMCPFEIDRAVERCVETLRFAAQEKGIGLHFDMPECSCVHVGDALRFRQIVTNLLSNAVKFTHEGAVTVTMACTNDRLTVRVQDTGCGISPEAQRAIFKPFTQEDETTTRRFGGTGLGLTISAELARQMGGELAVTSEPGRGSVFTLDIPLCEASCSVPRQAEEPVSEGVRLDGVRILLAEDNPDNQRLLTTVLGRIGAEVTIACNGHEAIKIALSDRFDLILMDMQMPELDGVQATQQLRRAGYDVPILMLTANVLSEDRDRCAQAGSDAFLTKPIDRDEIARVCRDWADRPPRRLAG